VFAPFAVSVIEFGEPLKACAHNELLLNGAESTGGLTTLAFATAMFVQPMEEVTFSVYVPPEKREGLVITGFCREETKLFGPLHANEEPGKEPPLKVSVPFVHTVDPPAERVGVGLITTVPCAEAVQPLTAVTVTL
jgi:hypothetical protein